MKTSSRGRPSKISDTVKRKRPDPERRDVLVEVDVPIVDVIVEQLRIGNYFETACAVAGIDKTTGYLWLKKGAKQTRGAFRDFSNSVEKAQHEAEAVLVGRIVAHGKEQWQANAWMLERKFPEKYGQRIRLTIDRELTDAVQRVEVEFRDEPQLLERALRALAGDSSAPAHNPASLAGEAIAGLPPAARVRPDGDAGLRAADALVEADGSSGEGVDE